MAELIELKLTEEESRWLADVMRSVFDANSGQDEDAAEQALRFLEALPA